VLRRGEGGRRRTTERVNPTKIYCKPLCKYHSVPPVQLLYAKKIMKRKQLENLDNSLMKRKHGFKGTFANRQRMK
jgi:hypothetical protein